MQYVQQRFGIFWIPAKYPGSLSTSTEALSDSDFLKRREPAGYHGSVMGAINKNPSQPVKVKRVFFQPPLLERYCGVRCSKADSLEVDCWTFAVVATMVGICLKVKPFKSFSRSKFRKKLSKDNNHELWEDKRSMSRMHVKPSRSMDFPTYIGLIEFSTRLTKKSQTSITDTTTDTR